MNDWECPNCLCKQVKVINHDPIWLDGDVVCAECEYFVRVWDGG